MCNSILIFVIFTSVFASYYSASQSLDELKKKYVDMFIECLKEYPVTAEDMAQLKTKQMPDKESTKCLFACAFKKAGMMDEKGFLAIEGVNKISEKYLSDDPEKLKKNQEFTEACKTVNDVPVNDGDKGCERAALIYKCSVEKSSQFNFI